MNRGCYLKHGLGWPYPCTQSPGHEIDLFLPLSVKSSLRLLLLDFRFFSFAELEMQRIPVAGSQLRQLRVSIAGRA
jgi:hypothetical protein